MHARQAHYQLNCIPGPAIFFFKEDLALQPNLLLNLGCFPCLSLSSAEGDPRDPPFTFNPIFTTVGESE